jgi:hypothetical protein
MIPPPDMHLFKIGGVPLQAKATVVPGIIGMFVLGAITAHSIRPKWPRGMKALLALTYTLSLVQAELVHNLGHLASGRRVGSPLHALVWNWGIMQNQYHDHRVLPRQHVGRAVGGPIASATSVTVWTLIYWAFGWIPGLRAFLEIALLGQGTLLSLAVLPTPMFDSGSILKWAVAGATGEESLGVEAVQTIGTITIGALGLAAFFFLVNRKFKLALAAMVAGCVAAADLYGLRGQLPS